MGLAFGGAQKNLGPAGLTLVIVREDLMGHALPACPSAFDYKTVADNQSMFNTPPTWGIYIAGLTFQWAQAPAGGRDHRRGRAGAPQHRQGRPPLRLHRPVAALPQQGRRDRALAHEHPLLLRDESRNDAFLAGAKQRGLLQLKGHKSVGGMRASLYNAMPLEGVEALIAYMQEFERQHA